MQKDYLKNLVNKLNQWYSGCDNCLYEHCDEEAFNDRCIYCSRNYPDLFEEERSENK